MPALPFSVPPFTMPIPGMMCPYFCVPAIRKAADQAVDDAMKGESPDAIATFKKAIEIADGTRVIRIPNDNEALRIKIEDRIREHLKNQFSLPEKTKWFNREWLLGAIAIFISALLTALSFFVSPFILGFFPWISAIAAIYLGKEFYSFESTKDALLTVSIFFLLGISIIAIWIPALSSSCSMALLTIGTRHIVMGIQKYLQSPAYPINLLTNIPDKNLEIDAEITLNFGDIVPADGKLVSPEACELMNTVSDGQMESRAVIQPGGIVKQGMKIPRGVSITIKITHGYRESSLYLIQKGIEARFEQPSDSFALKASMRYFLLILFIVFAGTILFSYGHLVFLAAGFKGIFSNFYYYSFLTALNNGIAVLTGACPCSLSLVDGFAARVMQQSMLKNNMHPIRPRVLQKDITDVVFDFNGTLTEPYPCVNCIEARGIDQEELYKIIYGLEDKEDHPFAKAISQHMQSHSIVPYESTGDAKRETCGVEKTINGHSYRISNTPRHSSCHHEEKGTVIYVENEQDEIIGTIDLQIQWRAQSAQTILQMIKDGKTVHICTGATTIEWPPEYAALLEAAYEEGKIIKVMGKVSTEKRDYIASLQNIGKSVVMIGDGANDGPAIAQADLGIVMQSEVSDAATEAVAAFTIRSLDGLDASIKTMEYCAQQTREFRDISSTGMLYFGMIAMLIPMAVTTLTAGCAMPVFVGPLLMLLPAVPLMAGAYHYINQVPEEALTLTTLNTAVTLAAQSGEDPKNLLKQTIHSSAAQVDQGGREVGRIPDYRMLESESDLFNRGYTIGPHRSFTTH